MNFTRTTPCKHCPFTTQCLKGWLGAERMREIVRSLDDDYNLFPCHESTHGSFDDDGNYFPQEQEHACAGALIYQEAHNQRAVLTRIAMARKQFDPTRLRGKERVVATEEAAVAHHTEGHRHA